MILVLVMGVLWHTSDAMAMFLGMVVVLVVGLVFLAQVQMEYPFNLFTGKGD